MIWETLLWNLGQFEKKETSTRVVVREPWVKLAEKELNNHLWFFWSPSCTLTCRVCLGHTCWWSNCELHICSQSCTFLECSGGQRALLLYTWNQPAVSCASTPGHTLIQSESADLKDQGRIIQRGMFWPFDNGSWVSLHSAEQFDGGLLPHGVGPQGNDKVRHLRDPIQKLHPLSHHVLDLKKANDLNRSVCSETVPPSWHHHVILMKSCIGSHLLSDK